MSRIYKLFFIMTCFILTEVALSAFDLSWYVKEIVKKCPQTNILMIKKSFIQLIDHDHTTVPEEYCKDNFTQNILSQCSKMKCTDLKQLIGDATNRNQGNIVGE